MSKATMPKPEAWVKPEHLARIKHWNGVVDAKNITLYSQERQDAVSIITTTQAEAYASARVREALEAALATVEELEDSYRDESLYVVQHCANNIRALLPD